MNDMDRFAEAMLMIDGKAQQREDRPCDPTT